MRGHRELVLKKYGAESSLSDGMGSHRKLFLRKYGAESQLSDGMAKFPIVLESDRKVLLEEIWGRIRVSDTGSMRLL